MERTRAVTLTRERGTGVKEIARRVKLDPSAVSRVLNGHRRPSLDNAKAIARELGITLDEFYAYLEEVRVA